MSIVQIEPVELSRQCRRGFKLLCKLFEHPSCNVLLDMPHSLHARYSDLDYGEKDRKLEIKLGRLSEVLRFLVYNEKDFIANKDEQSRCNMQFS